MLVITGIFLYHDYHERPGFLERKSLQAVERTTTSITLEWDRVRNTDTYVLYYKQYGSEYEEWTEVSLDADVVEVTDDAEIDSETTEVTEPEESSETTTSKDEESVDRADEEANIENKAEGDDKVTVTVSDLSESTKYVFVIRADSADREGFETKGKVFATKSAQKITGRTSITKLTSSKAFTLNAEAKTAMTYESSDTDVISVDESTGKLTPQGSGTATITVTATETDEYMPATKKFKIRVIDSSPVSASGASAHIIYHFDSDNCEVVKTVVGSGSIHVPQGIGYTGDKYIIAYGSSSAQRIISFDVDGDGKSISTPSIDLGHPNGFCYADSTGLCYSVKGWGGRCVTYNPETGGYDVFTLPYGASGIAYDRKENMFYTSSRTLMVAYSGDGSFSVEHKVGVVSHSGSTYTQDIGGHAGIMIRVLSGSSKHGTNYIDLYDMIGGQYLGTISCDLSEVESAFCDEDGWLYLLANNSSRTDYIWKTNINIEDIADGLER